jgi:hypothetical protein
MPAAFHGPHMRTLLILLAVTVIGGATRTARAQAPGMTMSYAQPVAPPMSPDDREILAEGAIDDGQWAGGVAASVLLGFGIGQGIEGRWHDTGWIFTLGETVSLGAVIFSIPAAFSDCYDCGPGHNNQERAADIMIGGMLVFAGLRIWEVGDAALGPSMHNDRFNQARARHPETYAVLPYVVPTLSGTGGIAGVSLHF